MRRVRKVDEIPSTSNAPVVGRRQHAGDARTRLLITKGSPESVLAICERWKLTDRSSAGTAARRPRREAYRQLSADGLRVLAVACRPLDVRDTYSRDDESHLVLAGFITFADPILDGVAAVLEELRRDGVTVKILTGDNPSLAQHVCRSIGLGQDRVVTGDDIAGLDDGALGHVAEQGAIFARVSPAEKNRIILALKHRGHVVCFLGDGSTMRRRSMPPRGISVMAPPTWRASRGRDSRRRQPRVLHRGILAVRRASPT